MSINNLKLIEFLVNELDFKFIRSSGAGGQNVNKVNSKSVLRWNIYNSKIQEPEHSLLLKKLSHKLSQSGELIITSDEFRDQIKNKNRCIEKFSELISKSLYIEKKRVKTKPTKASKAKRLESKKNIKLIKKNRQKLRW
jgi:ribosome-associated protein